MKKVTDLSLNKLEELGFSWAQFLDLADESIPALHAPYR